MTKSSGREIGPAIRRGRIEQLDIYDVSSSELQILENGSVDTLFLNFAIALISVASSFFITLLTTQIDSSRTFIVFVVISVFGFGIGLILLSLWWWHRRYKSNIFKEIQRRMPPEGIPAMIDVVTDGRS